MEENKDADKIPGEGNKPAGKMRPVNGFIVVGINLLVLAVYTFLIKLGGGGIGGLIINAFILFPHVVFCLVMALGKKDWIWLLSAILVLAIGFSTCTMIGTYKMG
jgi:hypothetical protein